MFSVLEGIGFFVYLHAIRLIIWIQTGQLPATFLLPTWE